MRIVIGLLVLLVAATGTSPPVSSPENYVFFDRDRGRIHEAWFANTRTFAGAQLKYTWSELEPQEGVYDLQPVLDDLAFLTSKGKKFFIQLQDVSFDMNIVNVPNYLRRNPAYHGGADIQYLFMDEAETKARPEGWVARRWDPAVRRRFHALLRALGAKLDGRIVGLALPETSVGFGEKKNRWPAGFTCENYAAAIRENMSAAHAAFPKSVVLQYANFMPGEWLPFTDRSYLKGIYRFASETGVGVGGPDLMPFRRAQQNHSLPLIRSAAGKVPTGLAVQWGNYEEIDPATRKPVTIARLHEIAKSDLRLRFLFWGMQEPYFTGRVVPYLERLQP